MTASASRDTPGALVSQRTPEAHLDQGLYKVRVISSFMQSTADVDAKAPAALPPTLSLVVALAASLPPPTLSPALDTLEATALESAGVGVAALSTVLALVSEALPLPEPPTLRGAVLGG